MTSKRFRQSLSSADLAHLQSLLDGAVAPEPVNAMRFFMGADPLGWVHSQHVPALKRALPGLASVAGGLCWDVHQRSPAQRSQDLALAAAAGVALQQRPQEVAPAQWVELAAGLNQRLGIDVPSPA